ncbi:MAG: hypothetical protein N3F66_10560 [Spirochaetes bacterium]|nr:hypothetical protein [Spirochaetota bacterium]
MAKKALLLLLIISVFVQLSCATTPKDFSKLAFIFGKIENAEGDMALKYVDFVSRSFTEKSKYFEAEAHKQKGYFWLKDLKMGSYRAVGFFQQTLMQAIGFSGSSGTYYSLNKYGHGPFLVRIQRPGVYYMGTYKYGINPKKLSVTDLILGSPTTFNMVKVENDDPKEILEWILKNKISKKSPWYSIIEKTINERSWINAEDTVRL